MDDVNGPIRQNNWFAGDWPTDGGTTFVKPPVEEPVRNNWFVVERPTDSGTVFVKPPAPGSDSDEKGDDGE